MVLRAILITAAFSFVVLAQSSGADEALIAGSVPVPPTAHWRRSFQILASYQSWEEHSQFYSNSTAFAGRSIILTPCLGGGLSYQNTSYDLTVGGCYGLGKAHSEINAANVDTSAAVNMFSLFAKGLKKLTNSGSGLGLQGGLLNRSITATMLDGSSVTADHLDVELMMLGRLAWQKFFFDFKGGTLIGQPSALWIIEFGCTL
jgi:hypothetical protein